jgi:hypothetical protein
MDISLRGLKEQMDGRKLQYEREINIDELDKKFLFNSKGCDYRLALWKGILNTHIIEQKETSDPYTIRKVLSENLKKDCKIVLERYEGAGSMRCYFDIISPEADGILIIEKKI